MATVPMLGGKGWVNEDMAAQADHLFACFLTSDYSQSKVYYRNISSYQYILAINSNDAREAALATKSALIRLYERYFESVEVEVSVGDATEGGQLDMSIVLTIFKDGKSYSLNKLIKSVKSKVESVTDVLA